MSHNGPLGPRLTRVLVVDDDRAVCALLTKVLERNGFRADSCATPDEARTLLATIQPDIMLLDLMLAGDDGLGFLSELRRTSDLPVILVTAKRDEMDRILGLRLGADDYIVKPFSPGEVVARVQTVLRRTSVHTTASRVLDFGDLCLDLVSREVTVNGELVELTAKEFDLLAFLAGSPRQVFSREQLLRQVWSSSGDWQDSATVTEHVRRIRRKIETDPNNPRRVVTVRSVGYRFEA
ncbi:MAG TPA: response regulator transcription factor [Acidimicrobiales bacterium]|nr:response regulator transcription factor [Acidimicrobiales bacterium]